MILSMALGTVLVWTGPGVVVAEEKGLRPLVPLVAALHVHSTFSTGGLSVDQLAERGERLGLDAIILSDNFVLRYEYGVFPLRGVLRHTVTLPSVLESGVDRYLAAVAEAQARHPGILLIPGVEVAPHYFWTGSLWHRNLTMHNMQKNLLVFGLFRAEDYAALPVDGNPTASGYGWETALNLLPGLLLIPAAWLWRLRIARRRWIGTMPYRVEARHRAPAVVLGTIALLLLLNAWPFTRPAFSIYDPGLGYRPYQALIDHVTARGGLVIWSMPEARDFNVHSFGPLGSVTVRTDPYPEALMLTNGYTGFGGVYEDNRSASRPGGIWDQLIGLSLRGQRGAVPYAAGEVAFHGPGHDTKELDHVVTVLWVRERTAAGVVEAFRTGRHYGVQRSRKPFGFRLDTFRIECDAGARGADPGETLEACGSNDRSVRVAVSATDHGAHPVTVTIIRSGEVIARVTGETPLDQRVTDAAFAPTEAAAYRVEVRGDGEILSNPIFVGPVPGQMQN